MLERTAGGCLLLAVWLLLLPSGAGAQALLSGTVRDSLTQQPLPQASVYLLNTTLGTTTDAQGRYVLHRVPPGSYAVAASYLGYRPGQRPLVVSQGARTVDFSLLPAPAALGEVVVRAPPTRAADYQLFKQVFLGSTRFSRQCRLHRPPDLTVRFDPATQRLTARTPTALEVNNLALGYRLTFHNLDFRVDFADEAGLTTTQAQVQFQELPGTAAQQARWAANRLRAYRGSLLHFLRAVYAGQLPEQGFRVQRLRRLPNRRWVVADSTVRARQAAGEHLAQTSLPADTWRHLLEAPAYAQLQALPLPADSIRWVDSTGQVRLRFRDYLAITYLREPTELGFREPGLVSGRWQAQFQESVLGLRRPRSLVLAANGALALGLRLVIEGYWGYEKIGELLPLDYVPPAVAGAGPTW